jgi:hypothetical protein
MKTINFRFITFPFLLILILFFQAIKTFASDKEVDRISDRIAVINDGYFRVVAINTGEGIVMIDAHVSVEDMQACKELIAKEFNTNDFKYIVYSHGDLEHILGYPVFENSIHIGHLGLRIRNKRNAKYLAVIDSILPEKEKELAILDSTAENHSTMLDEINGLKWRMQAIQSAMKLKPDIEFSDRMNLTFDSLTVELIYYGMGHGYSIFVSVPEEKFLYCSTASSTIPIPFWFLEYNTDFVDVNRSIGILSEFVNQPDTLNHIIPCHGPYLTNNLLKENYDYHKIMYEYIKDAVNEGMTLEEVSKNLALDKIFANYSFAQNINDETIEKHTKNIELLWYYLLEAENQ